MELLGAPGAARLERGADDAEVCLVLAALGRHVPLEGLDAALDGRELPLERVRERRDLRARVVPQDALAPHERAQLAQTELLLPQLVRDLLRAPRVPGQRPVPGDRARGPRVEQHRDLDQVARPVRHAGGSSTSDVVLPCARY